MKIGNQPASLASSITINDDLVTAVVVAEGHWRAQ